MLNVVAPYWAYYKIREPLLKGKAQYNWPPCLDQLVMVSQTLFTYLQNLKEVNRTESSPSISVPCLNIWWQRMDPI